MKEVLPHLLGGLGLFLYAIFKLSEILKVLFNNQAKYTVTKVSLNLRSIPRWL